jgi:hypothetical protein
LVRETEVERKRIEAKSRDAHDHHRKAWHG